MGQTFRHLLVILLAPVLVSCSNSSPTLNETLQEQLRSVAGPWRGITTGDANTITLEFSLTQQANGQLQGSGTMKEANAPNTVAITVTGTFSQPLLTLSFAGMVYEGRAVTGAFRGEYTTVAGLANPLTLTAAGYERMLPLLLNEQ